MNKNMKGEKNLKAKTKQEKKLIRQKEKNKTPVQHFSEVNQNAENS